jgi:hypothetical protein
VPRDRLPKKSETDSDHYQGVRNRINTPCSVCDGQVIAKISVAAIACDLHGTVDRSRGAMVFWRTGCFANIIEGAVSSLRSGECGMNIKPEDPRPGLFRDRRDAGRLLT